MYHVSVNSLCQRKELAVVISWSVLLVYPASALSLAALNDQARVKSKQPRFSRSFVLPAKRTKFFPALTRSQLEDFFFPEALNHLPRSRLCPETYQLQLMSYVSVYYIHTGRNRALADALKRTNMDSVQSDNMTPAAEISPLGPVLEAIRQKLSRHDASQYLDTLLAIVEDVRFNQHDDDIGGGRCKPLPFKLQLWNEGYDSYSGGVYAYLTLYASRAPVVTFVQETTDYIKPDVQHDVIAAVETSRLQMITPFRRLQHDSTSEDQASLRELVKFYFLANGYVQSSDLLRNGSLAFYKSLAHALKKLFAQDTNENHAQLQRPIHLNALGAQPRMQGARNHAQLDNHGGGHFPQMQGQNRQARHVPTNLGIVAGHLQIPNQGSLGRQTSAPLGHHASALTGQRGANSEPL
jgi:hypothetical protein